VHKKFTSQKNIKNLKMLTLCQPNHDHQ